MYRFFNKNNFTIHGNSTKNFLVLDGTSFFIHHGHSSQGRNVKGQYISVKNIQNENAFLGVELFKLFGKDVVIYTHKLDTLSFDTKKRKWNIKPLSSIRLTNYRINSLCVQLTKILSVMIRETHIYYMYFILLVVATFRQGKNLIHF